MLHFAATKKAVLTALDRLARIVKSNPRSVEILQCVRLESYGKEVYAVATSSMASARVKITDATAVEGGNLVVSLDRLKDRVSKAADVIQIQSSGTSMRIISSGDQRLGLALNDPEEFPTIEWVEVEESYGLVKADLVELFKLSHSLTNQSTALTPAFLQVRLAEQRLWVANGNSYQVFPVKCNPTLTSSIPTQTLFALSAFVEEAEGDTVWLSQLSEEAVVVSVGNDHFQTSPLAVEFPDLSPTFERVRVSTQNELEIERTRLALELMKAKTSADQHGRVTLTIDTVGTTMVKVEAQSAIGDWYESQIPAIWTGKPERILTFNLESLLKFLQTFKKEKVVLRVGDDFKGDLSAVYCEEGEHEGIVNQYRI